MGRARVHSGRGRRCDVDSDVDSGADSGVEEATGGAGEVESSATGTFIEAEDEGKGERVAGSRSRARMMNVSSFRPSQCSGSGLEIGVTSDRDEMKWDGVR